MKERDMVVVVVGGTGQTGTLLVEELRARGHEAVAAARSTGVDVISGGGLEQALAGADVVVDVLNTTEQEEAAATAFFRESSENVAAAARAAGVRHHVLLSIVGLEAASDLAYYRAKLAQEAAVKAGGVPYTIVRATQFHTFLAPLIRANSVDGEARLAPVNLQPIDLADLTTILADVVESEPASTASAGGTGGTVEVAGPEVLPLDEIGRRLAPDLKITSDGKPFFGANVPVNALVAGPGARLGTITLADWQAADGG
ncbi:NmrA family transcriptional regulator [Actinoplanes palleronii]|uniref:NmrA family transcriptional regulator n=2 Tax=Actinoplanes palleronii TaxID=113570 RepID=A0ABQ4B4I3_9ACTN|nr:NmrA family transcriptional regulator [Actinoplanes palleronii]